MSHLQVIKKPCIKINNSLVVYTNFATLFRPLPETASLRWFANNKGADQPAHQRSLISAFIIRFLESITSRLAAGVISIFYLVSVAKETGLKLPLLETLKTGFLATKPM